MTDDLRRFAQWWLGATDTYPVRRYGLCTLIGMWMEQRGYDPDRRSKLFDALTDRWGGASTPFNTHEMPYISEALALTMHLNPRRLAFVQELAQC